MVLWVDGNGGERPLTVALECGWETFFAPTVTGNKTFDSHQLVLQEVVKAILDSWCFHRPHFQLSGLESMGFAICFVAVSLRMRRQAFFFSFFNHHSSQ